MMNNVSPPIQAKSTSNQLAIICLLIVSFVGYFLLGYETERTQVYQVFGLFAVLFVAYGGLYRLVQSTTMLHWVLFSGIAFRVLLLFVLPNLSDDFYRFNWDGRLLVNGISPFAALPIHFVDGTYIDFIPSNITPALYDQLNSPEYFTIYPPVCQFVFWIACSLFPEDLQSATILMKGFMCLFEVGSVYLLYRLIKAFGGDEKKVVLYALNPLVIVELTGNLHFEAAMIFFTLLAVWFLVKAGQAQQLEGDSSQEKRYWMLSAIAMGLAISSKLIPLIFLPLLIPLIGWWRSFWYGFIAGVVTLLGFLPLFTFDILQNLFSSIGLYFQKFEFNASVYYLVRWVGYQYYGYNIIQFAGKWLALLTLGSILVLAFWRGQERGVRSQGTESRRSDFRFWFSLEGVKLLLEEVKLVLEGFWKRVNVQKYGLSLEESKVLLEKCLFALLLYFAFANIVHPWYVCSLVALCVFTPFRFSNCVVGYGGFDLLYVSDGCLCREFVFGGIGVCSGVWILALGVATATTRLTVNGRRFLKSIANFCLQGERKVKNLMCINFF